MERTVYSKYSNERAKRFCIRTDIVMDDAGEKKVYKHALTPEARTHIAQIVTFCQRLNEAYKDSAISFCPCAPEAEQPEPTYVTFPFLAGESLQDELKRAVEAKDDRRIEHILSEYIRRISENGGELPFVVTDEFEMVFGPLTKEAGEIFAKAGKHAKVSAQISDIDMILSNLFTQEEETDTADAKWQVIDYEWTFDFPIPKGFLIYRGLYFAYYQVLYHTDWSLKRLLAMAGITDEETMLYQRMEEHFQKYMGTGALPVRNMQRALGTRIVTLEELLRGSDEEKASGDVRIPEAEWLRVRKIRYQIDRAEYQDGSHVCSGWAFATTWDGRHLPVDIQVTNQAGKPIAAEISRRERRDVVDVLRIRQVTDPLWGFDCVWIAPPEAEWKIHFSLGKKECAYQSRKRQ